VSCKLLGIKKVLQQQKQLLQELITNATDAPLKPEAAAHLAAITLAAMEGAYQLSVSTKQVMPDNYATQSLIQMLEATINSH